MCLFHPRRCAAQWQDQPCSRPPCSSSHPRRLLCPLTLLPARLSQDPTFGGDQRAKGPGTCQVMRTLIGRKLLFAAVPAPLSTAQGWGHSGCQVSLRDSPCLRIPLESLSSGFLWSLEFREPHACTSGLSLWYPRFGGCLFPPRPRCCVPQGAPTHGTRVQRASTTRSPSQ